MQKKMDRVTRKVEASLQVTKMPAGPRRAVAKLRSRDSAAQLIEVIRIGAQTAPQEEDFAREGVQEAPKKLWMTDPPPASFE